MYCGMSSCSTSAQVVKWAGQLRSKSLGAYLAVLVYSDLEQAGGISQVHKNNSTKSLYNQTAWLHMNIYDIVAL